MKDTFRVFSPCSAEISKSLATFGYFGIVIENSIPILGRGKSQNIKPIKGSTPDPHDRPPGCQFMPRCDFADQECINLFELQLNSIPSNSKILVKNHPRDDRSYYQLLESIAANRGNTIYNNSPFPDLRFIPLELLLNLRPAH